MYEFLDGRIDSVGTSVVVLRTGGVGWLLQVSERCATRLRVGEETRLLVHLAVSENSLALYGFLERAERSAFRELLALSGVGPALALGILSALSAAELAACVQAEDTDRLTRIKGVGKKKAERLVLELRDRLAALPVPERTVAPTEDQELLQVLLDLGFRPAEARDAVQRASTDLGPDSPLEERLRFALRATSHSG